MKLVVKTLEGREGCVESLIIMSLHRYREKKEIKEHKKRKVGKEEKLREKGIA